VLCEKERAETPTQTASAAALRNCAAERFMFGISKAIRCVRPIFILSIFFAEVIALKFQRESNAIVTIR
jgi:hypothetical protein